MASIFKAENEDQHRLLKRRENLNSHMMGVHCNGVLHGAVAWENKRNRDAHNSWPRLKLEPVLIN
jgi:hypothetical protein